MRIVVVLLAAICASGTVRDCVAADTQDLLQTLLTQGIRLTDDVTAPVAAPTLTPSMTPDQRTAALQELAGKQEWSRFAKNSVTAPVTIDIESIEDSRGERVGHDIQNAFIVYASLEQLSDADFMEQMFGRPAATSQTDGSQAAVARELTDEELQQLGVMPDKEQGEAYAYLELPLLNRVIVRGVIHIQRRERPGAYEFAWQLEPAFADSEQFAGRWTELERNAVGRLVEGESHPYQGCGGFMGVYQLDEQQGQLLIESRMILHEPPEWFAGSNFLRSKLPLSMQENARSFRRKLAK